MSYKIFVVCGGRTMRQNMIKARKDAGLTQAELGKKIGKSMQTICGLERGWIEGKAQTWDALESILKVPQKRLRYQAQTGEAINNPHP